MYLLFNVDEAFTSPATIKESTFYDYIDEFMGAKIKVEKNVGYTEIVSLELKQDQARLYNGGLLTYGTVEIAYAAEADAEPKESIRLFFSVNDLVHTSSPLEYRETG